ncbi:RNA ligase [Streptomyces phage BillNye]|uniref:RNA ligase n=1 Tax=Streptomyces phage BillNye TaxID=2079426 RepID=A0A2L1IW16_9CAUD|nr:RNA ligase [Streptomyces phage BillNye]AVD99367.1 RNA ligase [Streptomyces phage BillNye]
MIEYPKTENLYKRNPKKKSELIIGEFTRPEFALINKWHVTEKVDGTNVQLKFFKDGLWEWYGRTANAQFTIGQNDYLDDLGFAIHQDVARGMEQFNLDTMTLYGELYGPKIQAGGNYSDVLGFRMFDIMVNDKTWLGADQVKANADVFGLDYVPYFGHLTTDEIFEMVSTGFVSTFSQNREYQAEGIVAVTPVPMYDQRGARIKFKLKTKDLKYV